MESFPINKIYQKYTDFFDKPGQYKVAVMCGTGCPSSSLIGNRIMDKIKCDFVVIWTFNMERKDYILSFRSKEVDVGKIANLFGGGGHKLASACSFSANLYSIQDLFYENSLPRNRQ